MSLESSSVVQQPAISYGSREWVALRAGTSDTRAANDSDAVDAAIQRAGEERDNRSDEMDTGTEEPVSADTEAHTSRLMQEVKALVRARMHAMRPGPRASFREADRFGELQRILSLAEVVTDPRLLVSELKNARHKSNRSFGKSIHIGENGKAPLRFDPSHFQELPAELIERAESLLAELGLEESSDPSGFTQRDNAYAHTTGEMYLQRKKDDEQAADRRSIA